MNRPPVFDRHLKTLERLLCGVGVLCLVICLDNVLKAQIAMFSARSITEPQGRTKGIADTLDTLHSKGTEGRPNNQVIGRLEIPKLSLSVPVMADYDSDSLLRGVGHIRGTAMPGGLGTLGLAGHRDTYFRMLRNITIDMEVRVIDKGGIYHYQVDSTEIVTPDQVEVLAIHSRPEMTLITCYPFDYLGAAPKRFIVHAHLISVAPDPARQ